MAWLRLHRWLGLGLAGWFVLLGLTGSLLVFYRGLDELIDPRLAPRSADTPVPAMEAVYQALLRAHPQRGSGWRIELPRAAGETITARYLQPVETAGEHFAPLLVTVDPASLTVVANRFWGQHLSTWLYDLHYSLLLGQVGMQAVGVSGVLLLASLLSGLWLWWPAPGQWRRALRFKRPAAPQRRVYDLHKLAGLASVPLLGVLAVTGALLAWPEVAKPVVAVFSPLTPMPQPVSAISPAPVPNPAPAPAGARPPPAWPQQKLPAPAQQPAGRLPLDAAIQRAQAQWPGSLVRWVDTPATPGAPYRLRVWQPGEPGDRFPDSLVWLDSRSGALLALRDPARLSGGDSFWRWLHPLHSGQAFGMAGRLLVCLSGGLPLLMGLTGWLRWRDKRRAVRAAATAAARRARG